MKWRCYKNDTITTIDLTKYGRRRQGELQVDNSAESNPMRARQEH